MKVEITGRHVVITPALRSYILKRLRKFDRMLGDETHLHVIIDVTKGRHTAEIVLKSKLLDLSCKGQTADMYASILLAIDKLQRQALKHKSRIIETKRKRARVRAAEEKYRAPAAEIGSAAAGQENIVVEELERKPMTLEEAALELEHAQYPFVVFRDIESDAVNVLYRRRNGSLAVIRA